MEQCGGNYNNPAYIVEEKFRWIVRCAGTFPKSDAAKPQIRRIGWFHRVYLILTLPGAHFRVDERDLFSPARQPAFVLCAIEKVCARSDFGMASEGQKPKGTLVIMPGTWHLPSAYDDLKSNLEVAGFSVHVQNFPSLDAVEPDAATCQADVDAARQQLLGLIEGGGQEVLVVCHSYGGIVGAGAAQGLSQRARRKQGKQGGVLGLVFITAFIVPEQISLGDFMGGKGAPYIINDRVIFPFLCQVGLCS